MLRRPDGTPSPGPGHELPLFEVEPFRLLSRRCAVGRQLDRTTIVLGSAQRHEVVRAPRALELGAEVVRRRSGGGAVLLQPGDHLWIDAWIPRDDPLWREDISAAATWVGSWWRAALGAPVDAALEVHEGRAVPGRHGALVCFSGRGPGELFHGTRKIMGVSQWRSRQGALFHSCAYTHWDPRPLIELLDVDPSLRAGLARDLPGSTLGLDELGLDVPGVASLRQRLLSSFPDWGRNGPAHSG